MNMKTGAAIAALAAVSAFGLSAGASAATLVGTYHSARTEVHHRLVNQDRLIAEERREGKISPREARDLHREDARIRMQARVDARLNGGRLTSAEYRTLNAEENAVSRQIAR